MERKTIHVNTGRSYDILVGSGLLKETGALVKTVAQTMKAAVVTDTNVDRLYGDAVVSSLEGAGFTVFRHVFTAGEASKNHQTLLSIYDFLAQHGFNRSDLIVALGGGVVGDTAGYAAATYMRGMDFVQVPTTLLAQVDSSIGGKTAVDLAAGKNLVGAFWQPRLVICDPGTLATLDRRIFADGMAEAVKHTLIRDRALYEALVSGDTPDTEFICRNIDIKRRVVENDEREKGERMLLNFGHTLGHAIEKVYHFDTYTHGEAVAIGMVLITRFAEKNGKTAPGTALKIEALLKKLGLPTECPAPLREILGAAAFDKKRGDGGITLVLLRDIGDAYLYKVTDAEFEEFFSEEKA